MAFRIHRSMPLLLIVALALTASACGKKDVTPDEVGLTQAQADDLMQGLASMAAMDRGGWLTALESTLLAHPTSNRPVGPTPLGFAGIGGGRRDTSFTRGSIAWNISYVYYDTVNVAHANWEPGTWYIEAASHAVGPLTLHDFSGSTGTGDYGHADTLNVDGFRDTVSTLNFRTLSTVDSALITITGASETRYYYFDNLVDCDVEMPKNTASPFPVSGTLEVHAFVHQQGSASHSDTNRSLLDATMTVTFDGTQTPRATITANTLDATEIFAYRIDLRTGAIVRAP